MGVVYLARAEGAAGFVKPVVVKRIIPDLTEDEKMARMFVREARILSNLHHPGVVGVLDFGEESGAYIMVLEYVHGYHLGRWNRYKREVSGRFPATLAIQIVIEVLSALHYAHTRTRPDGQPLGIVHRDISPSNVFIDVEGHVRLLDFGIARMTGDTAEYKTQEVTLKGKLAYLGPELLHGAAPTPQSDIYSAGVVLHELLLGKNEFRGREMSDTVNRVLNSEPTSVEAIRDDAPAGIDAILRRAMAKTDSDRFESAAEFAQALREIRGPSEDEISAALAAEVRRDFYGDMPERLGLEDLDSIEEAWRNPPEEVLTDGETDPVPVTVEEAGQPSRPSDPATQISRPRHEPAVPSPSFAKRAVKAAFAILVLIGAATGAAALALQLRDGGRSDRPRPEFTTTPAERQPALATAAEADAGSHDDTTPGRAEGQADAGWDVEPDSPQESAQAERSRPRPRPRPPRRKGGALGLSEAFAAKQAAILRCSRQHTAGLEGSPQVSIRFRIDAQGKVKSAQILPAELGSTALGKCLRQVAVDTRFPSLGEPKAFRIPVTIQRQR
jgi:serine/threonine-protein kinase